MSHSGNPDSIFLDEFFRPPIGRLRPPSPEIRRIATEASEASEVELKVEVSIIHYLLRSTMTLSVDAGEDDWAYFKSFSRECLGLAEVLAGSWHRVPESNWFAEFTDALKNSPRVDASAVDEIATSFTLSPKLYAFSFPSDKRLEISAVTPIHLRAINLIIWSLSIQLRQQLQTAESALLQEGRAIDISERYSLAWHFAENYIDYLLPHLFSLYFSDVNYSSLPIPRTLNAEVFARARLCTQTQIDFLMAHEFAHLLMHQDRTASAHLELEADEFAYSVLIGEQGLWENQIPAFYTANRWLFLYLSLDRILGAVLSDYEIDWVDLPIRDRETPVEFISEMRFSSDEEQDCQSLGDLILLRAKYSLADRGADWIKTASQEFRNRHCFRD
ncbi:ImmA/IrrE family metallo-endopeptidase [Streptomyces sp. 12297]